MRFSEPSFLSLQQLYYNRIPVFCHSNMCSFSPIPYQIGYGFPQSLDCPIAGSISAYPTFPEPTSQFDLCRLFLTHVTVWSFTDRALIPPHLFSPCTTPLLHLILFTFFCFFMILICFSSVNLLIDVFALILVPSKLRWWILIKSLIRTFLKLWKENN